MRSRTSPGWVARSAPATVAVPEVGAQQGREHPQGRGLACPVGPEEAEDLARADFEVDAAHGLDGLALAAGLETASQIVGLDDG